MSDMIVEEGAAQRDRLDGEALEMKPGSPLPSRNGKPSQPPPDDPGEPPKRPSRGHSGLDQPRRPWVLYSLSLLLLAVIVWGNLRLSSGIRDRLAEQVDVPTIVQTPDEATTRPMAAPAIEE